MGVKGLFHIGDKVVHPMHGAGVIDSIVQRRVAGQVQEYYQLKLSVGNMVVMVPTDNTGEIGMRPVVSGAKAEELMSEMEGIEVDMTSNWNRRYRENLVRLKSGDLLEVARVVKGLRRRESQRGLSNGERKMLHTAKQILISELVLAQSLPYETVESSVDMVLSH